MVIVAVAIGSILVALWRAAPEYGGEASVPGLGAEVRIVRDPFAIPHASASSEVDALSCAVETQGVLKVRSNTTRDPRKMRTERR